MFIYSFIQADYNIFLISNPKSFWTNDRFAGKLRQPDTGWCIVMSHSICIAWTLIAVTYEPKDHINKELRHGNNAKLFNHDDVIKRKHFPRCWPLCGEFAGHRWIPHTKASDAELWFFSLICARINGWVNYGDAGDLRRHGAHYDVTVMT